MRERVECRRRTVRSLRTLVQSVRTGCTTPRECTRCGACGRRGPRGTTLAARRPVKYSVGRTPGRFERFSATTEMPIAALALLVAPAIVLETHARSLAVRDAAQAANWVIWIALCAEYAIKV